MFQQTGTWLEPVESRASANSSNVSAESNNYAQPSSENQFSERETHPFGESSTNLFPADMHSNLNPNDDIMATSVTAKAKSPTMKSNIASIIAAAKKLEEETNVKDPERLLRE